MGKAGWVSAKFEDGDMVPLDMLFSWIDESYRAVAPKKLIAELDARGAAAPKKTTTSKKKTAAKKTTASKKKKTAKSKKKTSSKKKKR